MRIKDRVLLAGTHLKDANIGLAMKSLFIANKSADNSVNHGISGSPISFVKSSLFDFGGSKFSGCLDFDINGHIDELSSYMTCPPLAFIIDTMAAQYINGDTWILKRKGKLQGEESYTQDAERLRRLIDNPNPMQSFNEFEVQLYTYLKIFGYSVIYAYKKPSGFDASYAEQLWNINPVFLEIKEKDGVFFRHNDNIESVYMNYGGERVKLNTENVYIIKDRVAPINRGIIPS